MTMAGGYQGNSEFEYEGEYSREYENEGEYSGEYEGEYEAEAEGEGEAAAEIMKMSSEAELEQFLPLLIGPLLSGLKALAPVVMRAAVPLLGNIAGQVLGGGSAPPPPPPPPAQGEVSSRRARDRFSGFSGEAEQEGEWWRRHHHHRWGRRWFNRWGGMPDYAPPVDADPDPQQGFLLGKILGGILGEGETEGLLLDKIFGGLFKEVEGLDADTARYTSARWFVRLARRAARSAASTVAHRMQSGAHPSWNAVRRIVLDAILSAAHHPGHAGHHHGTCGTCGAHRGWNGHHGHHHGGNGHHAHHDGGGDHHAHHQGASGRWVRHGSQIIIHL